MAQSGLEVEEMAAELEKILLSRKPELGLQFQAELGQVSQHKGPALFTTDSSN